MGALQDKFITYMTLRGFSPRTHESYMHAMEELVRFYMVSPDRLTNEQIQRFLNHIITERKLEWSTVNVYFSTYRCFYCRVLKRDQIRFSIPPRGRSKKLPVVLDKATVRRIINAPSNIKHWAVLYMAYGSGLRVSEICRLKPHHIESAPERMMVRVEQGKGRKDRYTLLSRKALGLLKDYWRFCRPDEWLFFGRDKSQPMSTGTAQAIYYSACRKAGIQHARGIHTLRHCFASHLMENGAPIYALKRWLGHSALSTTAGYCHLTREQWQKIRSPLDMLYQEK